MLPHIWIVLKDFKTFGDDILHKMKKGSYVIVIELEKDREIKVGSLGKIELKKGLYSYTGSAFGPGGVKRIFNHLKLLRNQKNRQRWHIDYLNSNSSSSTVKIFLTQERKECEIAESISLNAVEGFGSTDCQCNSHLHYLEEKNNLDDLRKCFEQQTSKFTEYSPKKFIKTEIKEG